MIRFEHPTLSAYRARPSGGDRVEGGRRASGAAPHEGRPDQPLVSVVTAVRNGDEHFAEAIESVLAQTYPNVEYIVVDGASTDGTLDILRSYGDRIEHWVSERDKSPFDGMNRAIALASGALVKIHGADDVMPPGSVELAVETWRAAGCRSDCVIRSDMEIVGDDGERIEVVGLEHGQRFMPPVLHPTWYVPLAMYERFGLYDPYAAVSSDNEMYFYLVEQGVSFVHAPAPLAKFRSGGVSSSFGGIGDTFAITRRYLGWGAATWVVGVHGLRRSARIAIERALGMRRSTRLRKALKTAFR